MERLYAIRYNFFTKCGDCKGFNNVATSTFEICSYLGHNPGVDGHPYETKERALQAWENFIKALIKDREAGKVHGDYWIEFPFKSLKEELEYLEGKVVLAEYIILGYETLQARG